MKFYAFNPRVQRCLALARKILLIMKLIVVILTAGLLHVSAASVAQKITYVQKNGTLGQLFSAITKQTGYYVVFSGDKINKNKTVNADFRNTDLKEVLNSICEDNMLSFTIDEKSISLKPQTLSLLDRVISRFRNIDVRGRLTSKNGDPIPGANVRVKGTKRATSTNSEGAFILDDVEENAVLILSSIGYTERELSVKQDMGVIVLDEKVGTLSDVAITVNTGYQRLSRERSAGSFGKPDMSIVENRSTSMNILQRLDGLIPGLTLNNSPGSEGVLIRGLSSVNANRTPLFVVDGVPVTDLNSINPQDVADVTVLKDATAASIWGSKASNGVIVITTKKGQPGEKIRVNYDGFISFQGKPDLAYRPVLNSQQYIQAAKEVFDPVAYPWNTIGTGYVRGVGMPPHEQILYNQYRGLITDAQATQRLDSLASINNANQISDLLYRNAFLMNHTLSLSGGGKVHSFYGSGAFTNTQSNRPGERDRTYKVNLRQDFNFNKYLQMYLITDLTNRIASAPGNFAVDTRFYPYQMFQDASGQNLAMPYVGFYSEEARLDAQSRSRINLDYTPLNEIGLTDSKENALLGRIVGGATVNIVKGLRFEGVYGYVRGQNKSSIFNDNRTFAQRNELTDFTVAATAAATPVYYLPVNGGKFASTNISQKDWTVRNQFIYDNSWNNELHQLNLLVGQEAQEQFSNTSTTTLRGYTPDLLTYSSIDYATLTSAGVANPVTPANGSRSILIDNNFRELETQIRFSSYYANGGYTYHKKYSLNGSWRIDKSNLFGLDKGAQNRPVWSAGAKWMLSNESFMKDISFINTLALRATYGVTGNSPLPGTAASFNILTAATADNTRLTLLPGGSGLFVGSPANSKLTWESTKTYNIGVDFRVLDSRLSGTIDVYNKNTSDLIGQLPVNPLTGYDVVIGNLGGMKNKGVEISLNSMNISTGGFTWGTSLNLAWNKNTIENLQFVNPVVSGNDMINQRYVAGYPAFALFAFKYAGLDAMGDPQIYRADGSVTKARNISKPEDISYMGTTQPKWSGGFSNIFTYKNFGLNVNAIFNLGHVMRRDVNDFYTGRLIGSPMNFTDGNLNAMFAERWINPGDETKTQVPAYVSNSSVSNSRRDLSYYTMSDVNVLDASYIKIRDITLNYHLPDKLLERLRMNRVGLRLQVSNLMVWKANKYGIDPEFQGLSASGNSVVRNLRTNQGTVSVGLNVGF